MAMSTKRLCLEPGCSNLVKMGRCKQHAIKNEAYKSYERQRMPLGELYQTQQWRDLRAYYFSISSLCVKCGIKDATILDHVTPHKGNVELFWKGPFQQLCHSCHASKTRKQDGWTGSSLKGY